MAVSTAVADVEVVGARKTYGDVVAVDDVALRVGAGEFFTLLALAQRLTRDSGILRTE